MEPTLLQGDHVYVGITKEFRRGDIVAFHSPLDSEIIVVKRLIGVPGDRIRLANNTLILNSRPVNEKYKDEKHPFSPDVALAYFRNFPTGSDRQEAGFLSPTGLEMLRKYVKGRELVVPDGQYFVLGDNRDSSLDSHMFGLVPGSMMVGIDQQVVVSYDRDKKRFRPERKLLPVERGTLQ
jgi:signal peptidase I